MAGRTAISKKESVKNANRPMRCIATFLESPQILLLRYRQGFDARVASPGRFHSLLSTTRSSHLCYLYGAKIVANVQSPCQHWRIFYSEADYVNPRLLGCPRVCPETPRIVNSMLETVHRNIVLIW